MRLKKLAQYRVKFNMNIEFLLVCLSALLGMIVLLLAVGGYSSKVYLSYISDIRLVLFNIVPVILLTMLLYALTGNAWISLLLCSLITSTICICNYYKLIFRDDPLLFEDIMLIHEASVMSSSYTLFVDFKMGLVVGSILAIIVLMYVISRHKKAAKKKRIIILLIVLVLGRVGAAFYQSDEIYGRINNYEILNRWSGTQAFISRGFLYPFIHSMSQYKELVPDGYDQNESEMLVTKNNSDIPAEQKVNIIVVMREAYCDFSRYGIDGFKDESFDLFHQLQNESYHGNLYVNVFAGGTVDTERGFLTGNFKVKENIRGNTNSYVWYLREQGYTVEGSHPFYQWFYNRRNVNYYLGFERYRFYEDTFGEMTEDYYPGDDLFYTQIYQDYVANKEHGKPYFSFNVNVQSHGPYATEYRLGEEEFLQGDQYSLDCKTAMDNYMHMIVNSDEELLKFVHILEQEKDPTIFVLFSDHLPWMGDGNIFYDEMGINFSQQTDEMNPLQYTTEYLIWGNRAAKDILGNDFVGEGPTISPCYLMNVLFEQCSWEGPAYMQVMDGIREVMPVVSTSGMCLVNGNYVCEIPREQKELYRKFEGIQFYWRNHFLF